MILQGTLGGLDIAGELIDVLVGEGVLHGGGVALVLGPLLIAARDPLVPACDEDHLGVYLQGVLPLLGEVVAPLGGLGTLHLEAVLVIGGVGASRDVVSAHGGQQVMLVIVVLGDTDGDLLHNTGFFFLLILVVDLLGVHGEPAPVGVLGLLHQIGGLTCAEGEEAGDLLIGQRRARVKAVLHGHEHGLIVPVEPQLLPLTRAEDVQVEHLHLGAGVGLVPEGQHEGDLGGLYAVLHGIRPGIEQGGVACEPGIDAVGVIRKHHVHACVGQQLALLSLHPRIVAAVVAVDGLVPESGKVADLAPQGVIVVPHGLGVLGGQLLHVHRIVSAGAADVPRPVEHGEGLILLEVAHVGVGEGHAAEAVGEDPRIGHDLMGIDEAVRGDDVGIGGSVVAVGEAFVQTTGGVIVLGLGGEVEADVGVDQRCLTGHAIGIDLAFKARNGFIGVESGGGGHIVDEEQVVACRELTADDLGVLVILQNRLARTHGGFGHGLFKGSLPRVDRHGHFDIVAVVGTELGLHTREGDGGIQTDTHALVDLVNDHTLSGVVQLLLIQHILGGLTGLEGILYGLGKADAQLGLASLLLAVHVQKALGVHGGGIAPHACIVAGAVDVEEVLACGLGVKGHPVGMTVHQGIEGLLGDGGGGYGRLVGSLPCKEVQSRLGVLLLPRGHGEAEGAEGVLQLGAVGEALADAEGLAVARAVLDGILDLGGGGDRQGQDGRSRGEEHEQAQNECRHALEGKQFHGSAPFRRIGLLYRIWIVLSTEAGDFRRYDKKRGAPSCRLTIVPSAHRFWGRKKRKISREELRLRRGYGIMATETRSYEIRRKESSYGILHVGSSFGA